MMKLRHNVTILAAASAVGLAFWAAGQQTGWTPVAVYSTSLSGRTSAQTHNLELAMKSINGKILPPHGEFSFNHTVGSWTAERGYVKAPVSFDGELIPAWGGGVCQASSTLYNAALLAGLEILERHRHRFSAKYVPPGQDAAVAQYDIDLRLKNQQDSSVKIEAQIVGDHAVCRILSRKPMSGQVSIEREISQVTAPVQVVRSKWSISKRSNLEAIRKRVIVNHGQPGMRVAVYRRTVTKEHSSRTLISEDTYPPQNTLIQME